ncbi:MAG: hypothetical protein HY982_01620 [Candidatus Magasanikbacteria bacterium]|nr:hypothetical protein [Candidatus Magasanikbacteria bacterium]
MLKAAKTAVIFGSIGFLFWGKAVWAFCPICTVAVGAGLGLSRWLGIDDTVSGIWIGGLLASLSGWTINWFNKRDIKFRGRKIITFLVYYLLVIAPLIWSGVIGHPFNKLWGVDKLVLGIIFGSVVFLAAVALYYFLKKKNNGRPHFPLEKVILPVGSLFVLSLIFYLIT